jgi:hypothetical protein
VAHLKAVRYSGTIRGGSPIGSIPPEGGESPVAHQKEHEGGPLKCCGSPPPLVRESRARRKGIEW